MEKLERQGKSHHTLAAYRRWLGNFIRWSETAYGTPFDPACVMARDVRDWKAYQQTVEKVAPATVNQRLVALSRFFNWAIHHDLSQEDPTTDVHALRLPPNLTTTPGCENRSRLGSGNDYLWIFVVEAR